MSDMVLLDAGPLDMAAHRGGFPEVDACQQWLARLIDRSV